MSLFFEGVAPGQPPRPHPPRHGHRSGAGPDSPSASRHRGNHGPGVRHQHSVHVQAQPGHHRSGRLHGTFLRVFFLCRLFIYSFLRSMVRFNVDHQESFPDGNFGSIFSMVHTVGLNDLILNIHSSKSLTKLNVNFAMHPNVK